MSNSISGDNTVLFGPEPPPGTRLGQYILVEKIASGGMGQVWKAQHETNGKFYALKLLPPMIAAHPDAWDQVLANFHLVEGLSHPNICPVKTLKRDQKYGPFLVMGFIEGVTLTRYRRGRTFTAEQVAALLKPVAEALDYAHSQGVIHRDIKHDNIMVVLGDDKETILATYVIDFGLAAEVRTTITQFSQQSAPIAGTLRYMAPEIWRGRPAVAQTDQYALAVIAYELMAGNFPFDCPDRTIMREAVLNEDIESIGGFPQIVNDALLRGMAKRPEERFSCCIECICLNASTKSSPKSLRQKVFSDPFNRELRREYLSARTEDELKEDETWAQFAGLGKSHAEHSGGLGLVASLSALTKYSARLSKVRMFGPLPLEFLDFPMETLREKFL